MAKKMTIEDLAEMMQRSMASKEDVQTVKEDVQAIRTDMNNGFTKVFLELDGLRDDVKQARGASNVGDAALWEKIKELEARVSKSANCP